MNKKYDNPYYIGIEMIKAGVKLDEGFADLLKTEVKRMKKIMRESGSLEEIKRSQGFIKNIILALTLTDEKIKAGIDMCNKDFRK